MQGVFASSLIVSPTRNRNNHSDSESDSDIGQADLKGGKDFTPIRINVGGTLFETTEKTLKKIPGSRLSRLRPDCRYFRRDKQEYFFDRDPEIFRSILNYHRLGELHLPLHLCGPLLERELQYWRIPEQLIEKCCWIHYIQLKSQKYSLVAFESFFADPLVPEALTKWRSVFNTIWETMNRPSVSRIALLYAIMAATFVCLSIFVFVAETHPLFHKKAHALTRNHTVKGGNIALSSPTKEPISINLNSVMNNNISSSDNESTNNDDIINVTPVDGLEYIDYICVVFFTIDLGLRLLTAPNRRRFLANPITVIEIIAVIPYYIDLGAHLFDKAFSIEMKKFIDVVHILRIFGVLRILKILRYYSGLQVLVYTLRSCYKDLLLMLTFIAVATLFFSSLIYYVDDKHKFTSIPAGFWWSIITMTTVGYGDIHPTQTLGYVVGSACALVGVLVVAFTVPILVNSFMLYYSHAQSIQIYKQEGRLHLNTENEKVYLDYSLKTLKSLSLSALLPKLPNLSKPNSTEQSNNAADIPLVGDRNSKNTVSFSTNDKVAGLLIENPMTASVNDDNVPMEMDYPETMLDSKITHYMDSSYTFSNSNSSLQSMHSATNRNVVIENKPTVCQQNDNQLRCPSHQTISKSYIDHFDDLSYSCAASRNKSSFSKRSNKSYGSRISAGEDEALTSPTDSKHFDMWQTDS